MKKFLDFLENLLNMTFDAEKEKEHPWFGFLWLTALWAAGAFLWGKFLNWGSIPFEFLDWSEITGARLAFLQDAVKNGVLPLHMQDATALHGVSDRFMAIPDVLLSPQILLLNVMQLGPFVLFNVILLFSLGVLGSWKLKQQYKLSLITFTLFFFLFNFNGHILSHLAVGHITWGGYFLLPWLILFTLEMLDGKHGWRWVFKFSLLLFLIFLQGSYHQFVWSLIFLGLIAVFNWKYFIPVMKIIAGSILLSMPRILPPAIHALEGRFNLEFIGGYIHLTQVFEALVSIKSPWESLDLDLPFTSLSWWEFDLFIGFSGLLVLVIGTFFWICNSEKRSWSALWLPMISMLILSMGRVYNLLIKTGIPLFAGERVSSRLIILPFLFLIFLAVLGLQSWIQSHRLTAGMQVGGWLLCALLVNDLWQYIKIWQISNLSANFELVWVDLSAKGVANHADPQYITAFWAGMAITLLTLVVMAVLSRKKAKA